MRAWFAYRSTRKCYSSHGLDDGKTRPGFEMDELTQAYAVFADNGLQVDIASPSGGTVVADKFNPAKPYNSRFLSDPKAVAKLRASKFRFGTLSRHRPEPLVRLQPGGSDN